MSRARSIRLQFTKLLQRWETASKSRLDDQSNGMGTLLIQAFRRPEIFEDGEPLPTANQQSSEDKPPADFSFLQSIERKRISFKIVVSIKPMGPHEHQVDHRRCCQTDTPSIL
jgi:hypothetical protein